MQTTSTWTLNNERKKMDMIPHEYDLAFYAKISNFRKSFFHIIMFVLGHLKRSSNNWTIKSLKSLTLSKSFMTLQLVSLSPSVRVNGSKDFLDFLHNDSSGKLMTSSRARFWKKNVGAEIWGILGVKNDPFWYCSSLSLTILLKISQKIALLKTFRTM